MRRLVLNVLFEALTIIGHSQLWLDEDDSFCLPPYRSVVSADLRELAWWDEDSLSWFLTKEVDVITPHIPNPPFAADSELTKEGCFGLGIYLNC